MADETAVSPPKKKKLPFKPTALRRAAAPSGTASDAQKKPQEAQDNDDALELFRRTKEMAPIMAADRERRLLRKQKHLQEEEEKRRAQEQRRQPPAGEKRALDEDQASEQTSRREEGDGEASTRQLDRPRDDEQHSSKTEASKTLTAHSSSFRESATPPPPKRSRQDSTPPSQTALDSPNQVHSLTGSSPSARVLRSKRGSLSNPEDTSPKRQRILASRNVPIVSLDSDSDEDVVPLPGPPSALPVSLEVINREPSPEDPLPQAAPEDEEEDEFAEYERKAAEQRARDLADAGKEHIHILVTSDVPGTEQCYVKFLFNKPLRLVRDSWIALQLKKGAVLPADQREDILLTWRRKRVYNSSTLLNLGIRPAGDGRIAVDGFGSEGLSEQRTRIHMEAWTLDLFQKMEREEELRRRREAGEVMSVDGDDGDAAGGDDGGDEPEPLKEVKLRIILKARDVDDVKLTVRPETTVETLVTGFRTQRNIEPEKEVSLWFDGERLADDTTMADAEIDDMDSIEVHIKTPRTGVEEISDDE